MTVQGWYYSDGNTMCFQQYEFNVPQVLNHMAKYVDLTQLMNGSRLNADATPYVPEKEIQIINDETNDITAETKKPEWVTVTKPSARKATTNVDNNVDSYCNPFDILTCEVEEDSWSDWDNEIEDGSNQSKHMPHLSSSSLSAPTLMEPMTAEGTTEKHKQFKKKLENKSKSLKKK